MSGWAHEGWFFRVACQEMALLLVQTLPQLHFLSAQPTVISLRTTPRSAVPAAVDDGVVVLAAVGLAAGAGLLQYSVSSGERGINAFLMREKRDNPFYKPFEAEQRSAPRWLSGVRLPTLPFVEVYGQSSRRSQAPPDTASSQPDDVAALYAAMDAAVEREEYDLAAEFKRRIDARLSDT
jgi:hypothetical protein